MLASSGGSDLFDITREAALEHLGMEVTVMGGIKDATDSIHRVPAAALSSSAASGPSGSDTPAGGCSDGPGT